MGASLVGKCFGRAIQFYVTGSCHDFHAFRSLGAKVKTAPIDQAQRFLRAILENDGVTHHFAVEIDVRFRDGCYVFKLSAGRF